MGLIVGIAIGAAYLVGTRALPNLALGDIERVAARAWLGENLDHPKWDEVRWWPAVTYRHDNSTFRSETQKAKEEGRYFGDVPDPEEYVSRVCRLKIRTKNRLGATELRDLCFVIDPKTSKVTRCVDYDRIRDEAVMGDAPLIWYMFNFEELYHEFDDVNGQAVRGQKATKTFVSNLADGVFSGRTQDRETPKANSQ